MLRRLILVSLAALAFAAPANAFSKEGGMQTMDDGVPIAFTRYTPDGAAPASGRPGVIVLHGLAGNRGTVEAISSTFATAGYSVLAYDARGHGSSGGEITLAGPREVADLRALRAAFGARAEVSDTKIGAWGISYGGGQIWNALAAGVPFAAVEVVETWTSLYSALWPQNLARAGIVAGLAAGIAARSPLVTGFRDDAVQSRNLGNVESIARQRSIVPRAGGLASIKTPVYMFQGRIDFVFDITQASQAFAGLGGPKKLYVGNFGHTPSTFPGTDAQYVLAQGVAWYDRHLKGTANGVDSTRVVIAKQGSATGRVNLAGLPKSTLTSYALPGRSVARGNGLVSRRTAPLKAAVETWGIGTVHVEVPKLARYPRLVVTVLAGDKVMSHGGLKPRAGRNVVKLANYCVYVPKGTRLRVTVGPSSPAGQIAYLGFGDSGSATIGQITLRLATLAKPISR
ncbi:MAG: CocE/NonD family hydrolase [Actinomycetota bacterium]|nr:CocE/NonD family hydrolase [Actinomycetota bacterium]